MTTRYQLLENIADRVEQVNNAQSRGTLTKEFVEKLYAASTMLKNWDNAPSGKKNLFKTFLC
jgi:hypothetical protein